jgi:hypothetical protein
MVRPDVQAMGASAAAEAHRRHAAERAVDDPVKLDRAKRIIRLALERGKLTIADLIVPEAGP